MRLEDAYAFLMDGGRVVNENDYGAIVIELKQTDIEAYFQVDECVATVVARRHKYERPGRWRARDIIEWNQLAADNGLSADGWLCVGSVVQP